VDGAPTAAVIDFNLGRGLSFDLARTLRTRGIPLVFITGYDGHLIPADFEGIELVQKPFELKRVVSAVAALGSRTVSRDTAALGDLLVLRYTALNN